MKTVSRVLNDEPHVRDEVRDRVLAAVRALNYSPNAAARALAGSRSYLLGLFLNNPSRSYISQVEYGVMRACRAHGYHLLVEAVSGTREEVAAKVAALTATVRMDGVILTPPLADDPLVLSALAERHLPVVAIAPAEDGPATPKVFMDDFAAARKMTDYLIGLGHQDIAFIAGPADHATAGRRLDGFKAALNAAGCGVRADWIRRGDFTFRSGLALGDELLSTAERPTAVFAANDDMALGVMASAHRLHLDVPDALSIVGFDDSPSAEVVWPQLTTIRQPTEEMAAAAAVMLIQMRGEQVASPVAKQLDFELVVRGSAAARACEVGGAPTSRPVAP